MRAIKDDAQRFAISIISIFNFLAKHDCVQRSNVRFDLILFFKVQTLFMCRYSVVRYLMK